MLVFDSTYMLNKDEYKITHIYTHSSCVHRDNCRSNQISATYSGRDSTVGGLRFRGGHSTEKKYSIIRRGSIPHTGLHSKN